MKNEGILGPLSEGILGPLNEGILGPLSKGTDPALVEPIIVGRIAK